MTPTYEQYRSALGGLKDLPGRTEADVRQADEVRTKALALADQAVARAKQEVDTASTAIQNELQTARGQVEALGRANLVPPQIRASGGASSATRQDVSDSKAQLRLAVRALRRAVDSEAQRLRDEEERRARAEASGSR